MKKIAVIVAAFALAAVWSGTATAHVTVKPAEALTGAFQTFTVGVPNEKDIASTAVKLEIPANLQHVSPNVKPGWKVDIEKEGTGEEAKVKSITWSGGSVPAGFREEFAFSAKTPDTAGDVQWRAYQTYADGVVVAWDKTAKDQPKKADGSPDFSTSGPFSVTKVAAKSQAQATQNESQETSDDDGTDVVARLLGVAALALALVAFSLATRKTAQDKTKK